MLKYIKAFFAGIGIAIAGVLLIIFRPKPRSGNNDGSANLDGIDREQQAQSGNIEREGSRINEERGAVDRERGRLSEEAKILERDKQLLAELEKRNTAKKP